MLTITNKNDFIKYFLVIGAIIVLLNLVGRAIFFRLDLTDNQIYSLSRSSRDVIAKLEDKLTAKVFFSGDLPGQLANSKRYLQDLLEEYEAYSHGRFHFEFINPDQDPKAQEQARYYSIYPVQMQAVENDKLEIKNVYMGLVFIYNDKKESVPMIQTTEGLEYNLTAAIKKVTSTNVKTIGVISEENEEITTENLTRFLRQIYQVQNVYLSGEIASHIDIIIMNGVTDTLSTDQLYNLDQFLMRGGKLFIGQGRVKDMLQQGFAMNIRSNIYAFLEHYGFRIGEEMVIDQSCSQVQVQSQQGFFMIRNAIDYPPLPLIRKFNPDHVLTKNMGIARLFFVSEIIPTEKPEINFTPLMYTSDRTGVLKGPFYQIQPNQNPMMRVFPFPSKCVAALAEGRMTSFFKDSTKYNTKPNFRPLITNGQIVLVTDNQFFNDKRAGGIQENTQFILNAVDYLTGDQELITLRSRDIKQRPLDQISDGTRQTLKWLNILLPPALVVVFGLLRWKRNRIQRKVLEEIYG